MFYSNNSLGHSFLKEHSTNISLKNLESALIIFVFDLLLSQHTVRFVKINIDYYIISNFKRRIYLFKALFCNVKSVYFRFIKKIEFKLQKMILNEKIVFYKYLQ